MKNKDYYEWPEESFEDKVKREMAMPVWERPSVMNECRPALFWSFDQQCHRQGIAL